MPQKLCGCKRKVSGCKGKVKRLCRKRWQRITKRQNKKPLRNIVLKDFPLFIFTLKSLFYFLKNILLRYDLIHFELPFHSLSKNQAPFLKSTSILFEINWHPSWNQPAPIMSSEGHVLGADVRSFWGCLAHKVCQQ